MKAKDLIPVITAACATIVPEAIVEHVIMGNTMKVLVGHKHSPERNGVEFDPTQEIPDGSAAMIALELAEALASHYSQLDDQHNSSKSI